MNETQREKEAKTQYKQWTEEKSGKRKWDMQRERERETKLMK